MNSWNSDVVIVFLAILPIILLATADLIFIKYNRIFSVMLISITVVHELVLVAYPSLFAVFSNFEFEKLLRYGVDREQYIKVLLIENIFIICFLSIFIFSLLIRQKRNKVFNIKDYRFFLLLVIIGILIYSFNIVHRPSLDEIIKSYQSQGILDNGNVFMSLLTNTFQFPSLIAASFLSIKGKNERYPKYFKLLGILLLILVIVTGLITGVRGKIVWVIDFGIIVAILKRRFKPLVYIIILLALFLPLNTVMVQQIRPITSELANEGSLTPRAIYNILGIIIHGIDNKSDLEKKNGILETLAERAQGPRNSFALIKNYDLGEGPGLKILMGALVFPIPRSIYPNKPVTGSPDNNFQDAGIFKVMAENYNMSYITMGPLLASAHSYWVGGYLGVMAIAILTALFWLVVIKIASNFSMELGALILLICCCALLIDGLLTMFYPLYSLINISWKALLPILILLELRKFNIKSSFIKKSDVLFIE